MRINPQISVSGFTSRVKDLGFGLTLSLALVTVLSLWTTSTAMFAFADHLGKREGAVQTPFRLLSSAAEVSQVSETALAAGLAVGSTVRAVNGEKLLGLGTLNRILSSSRSGDVLVLEIENGSDVLSVPITLEGLEWEFKIIILVTFVHIVLPIACTFVGLKAIWIRPRSMLAWLTFGMLVGMGNQLYIPEIRPTDTVLSLLQTCYIQIMRHSWFICILLFSIRFPEKLTFDRRWPYLKWIIVVPLFLRMGFLTAANLATLIDFSFAQFLYNSRAIFPDLINNIIRHLPELTLLLAPIILSTRYWAEDSRDERRRLRLFWSGTIISLGPAILLTLVTEILGTDFGSVPLSILFLSVVPTIIFPGVVRHVVLIESATDVWVKLRDLLERYLEPRRLHLVRTFSGAIAVVCFLIWVLSGTETVQFSLYFSATAAFLSMVCHPVVVNYLRNWIDATLFSEHHRIESSLVDLEHRIPLDQDLQTLPQRVCRELGDILSADTVCLVQSDTDTGLFHVTQGTSPELLGCEVPGAVAIMRGLSRSAGSLRIDHRWNGQAAQLLGSDGQEAARALRSRLLVALPDRPGIRGFVSCSARPLEAPYTKAEGQLVASVSVGLSRGLQVLVLLEEVVQESAAKERLAIEKIAAEEAGKAKGEFLASMSHELRTPLSAILGYSELLQEDAESDGNKELCSDLAKIQSAGEHLLDIVNSVLDLSRIEAGRMELHIESFRTSVLLNDIKAIILPLAAKNGNQFIISCSHQDLILESDRIKIRQCLINLLGNACKFTKEGKISLVVSKHEEDICFTVSDTGIGMTNSQIDKLFKAFSQVHDSKHGIDGGTGLGLVISKQFAQMLGGDIGVESEQGVGTTFRLTVPIKSGSRKALSLEKEPVSEDGSAVVLVIDDDPTVHEVMDRSLARAGFRTVHGMNGDEGLQVAKEVKPHVILLDILMANMDGWRVMMELKEGEDTEDIPIVISSVLDRDDGDPHSIADDYLRKPVSRDQLARIVRRYCNKQPSEEKSTVLVVDDDEEIRSVICRLLESQECSVVPCAGAREALAVLAERRVDLVLTDLMMPGMDGFEFIGELRRCEAADRIPIVVLTGKHLSAQEKQQLAVGVTAILGKAADWQDRLAEQVRNAVEGERTSV